MDVAIVNGSHLVSNSVCKYFCWELQGQEFRDDAMLVPLGGAKTILGV